MWQLLQDMLDYLTGNLLFTGRDVIDVLFSLFLALVIGVIISQIYKYTHRGMNYELSFMSTLVFLSPIVSVVMMFIRGDLVLSLGLIGSLSIIRFRTPIKDTRDMVYLFWAIAVGLGCGTSNWVIVIISTIFMVVFMFLFHFIKYGRSRNNDFVLAVSGISKLQNELIDEIIRRYSSEARIRSKEVEEDYWEIIFELRFARLTGQVTDQLINDIKALDGVNKVALLAPQLALPV